MCYSLSTYPSKIKAKLELEEVVGMKTFPEDITFTEMLCYVYHLAPTLLLPEIFCRSHGNAS